MVLSPCLKKDEEKNFIFEKQKKLETSKLQPDETNWFKVLTSSDFLIRLVIVLLVTVYCIIVILTVTMNSNSNTWFNKLHKPDWGPDGVVIAIIFGFLGLLFAWVWYRFSMLQNSMFYELLILVILVLFILWTVFLFQGNNLTVAKYLACFFLGLMVILLVGSFWSFGFSDVTLYTFLYTGWLIVMVFYTFGLHQLDKDFKILSLVSDKNSSLYKKKMKMELVEGIKITEAGEKIEFDPLDQE